MRLGAVTLVALLPSVLVQGASELGWGNDTDVTSFVTVKFELRRSPHR